MANQNYFVYQHIDPETMACVYIGCGPRERVVKTTQRNEKYSDFFSKKSPIIEIIREFSTKTEALKVERNLINIIRPKLNILMSGHKKETLEKRRKLSIAHGGRSFKMTRKHDGLCIGVFINQKEASEASGASRSSISNVLAGIAKSTKYYYIERI